MGKKRQVFALKDFYGKVIQTRDTFRNNYHFVTICNTLWVFQGQAGKETQRAAGKEFLPLFK
jgi:hypothetical protein